MIIGKQKISVCFMCYSRQAMLDIVLPCWLKQDYEDYEILIAVGPEIKKVEHPRVKYLDISAPTFSASYNKLFAMSTGQVILITQTDMQASSATQLSRMYNMWSPGKVITERFFKDGKRDGGLYMQFCMVEKEDLLKAGGFCERYDDPSSAAHEDADLMASLLELGLNLYHTETPKEEGVFHINHPRPDYYGDPILVLRVKNGRKIFDSRHGSGVMALYAKQFARMLTNKRRK